MALSRSDVEAMEPTERIDALVEMGERLERLETLMEVQIERRKDLEGQITNVEQDLSGDVASAEDRLHRERSKLARRVSAIEDEMGVTPNKAVAIAEAGQADAGMSKLGRLIRHGPEAATDNPPKKAHRAKAIVDNWDRWETTELDRKRGVRVRKLGSRAHDLKSRLEDVRGESLSWKQVYRAMELIDDWSGGNVSLKEGVQGKYVLVITEELDDA